LLRKCHVCVFLRHKNAVIWCPRNELIIFKLYRFGRVRGVGAHTRTHRRRGGGRDLRRLTLRGWSYKTKLKMTRIAAVRNGNETYSPQPESQNYWIRRNIESYNYRFKKKIWKLRGVAPPVAVTRRRMRMMRMGKRSNTQKEGNSNNSSNSCQINI